MVDLKVKKTIDRILFKIRLYREANSVNQSDLAEALGIGLRSYQRIEAGETICDIEFLIRFCHYFKISFCKLTSPEMPVPIEEQKLFIDHEEKDFEKFELINRTNFINFSEQLHQKYKSLDEIGNSPEFIHAPFKLVTFNSNKKYVNNLLAREMGSAKNKFKTFENVSSLDKVIGILDNVHYHQPKYSKINPAFLITKNFKFKFKAYNRHFFIDGIEPFSISLLETI